MDSLRKYKNNTKYLHNQEHNGIIISISGIVLLIIVFLTQYIFILSILHNYNINSYSKISITEDQSNLLNSIAFPTLIILLTGLILCIFGFGMILNTWIDRYILKFDVVRPGMKNTVYSKLQKYLSEKRFLIFSLCYFIIISFLSSTIIYRPYSSFSETYGIMVPSWYIIGCCGMPGSYPVLTVYLTDQFGLIITPLDIILSTILSLLVGINASLFTYKIQNRNYLRTQSQPCNIKNKKNSTLLSLGVIFGLFVECPVCTGSLIMYFIGSGFTATGITISIINQVQPFFVIASFFFLILPPILVRIQINKHFR